MREEYKRQRDMRAQVMMKLDLWDQNTYPRVADQGKNEQ